MECGTDGKEEEADESEEMRDDIIYENELDVAENVVVGESEKGREGSGSIFLVEGGDSFDQSQWTREGFKSLAPIDHNPAFDLLMNPIITLSSSSSSSSLSPSNRNGRLNATLVFSPGSKFDDISVSQTCKNCNKFVSPNHDCPNSPSLPVPFKLSNDSSVTSPEIRRFGCKIPTPPLIDDLDYLLSTVDQDDDSEFDIDLYLKF